jgi:hypothetical protein
MDHGHGGCSNGVTQFHLFQRSRRWIDFDHPRSVRLLCWLWLAAQLRCQRSQWDPTLPRLHPAAIRRDSRATTRHSQAVRRSRRPPTAEMQRRPAMQARQTIRPRPRRHKTVFRIRRTRLIAGAVQATARAMIRATAPAPPMTPTGCRPGNRVNADETALPHANNSPSSCAATARGKRLRLTRIGGRC